MARKYKRSPAYNKPSKTVRFSKEETDVAKTYSKKELVQMARAQGLKGYSVLNKGQLVAILTPGNMAKAQAKFGRLSAANQATDIKKKSPLARSISDYNPKQGDFLGIDYPVRGGVQTGFSPAAGAASSVSTSSSNPVTSTAAALANGVNNITGTATTASGTATTASGTATTAGGARKGAGGARGARGTSVSSTSSNPITNAASAVANQINNAAAALTPAQLVEGRVAAVRATSGYAKATPEEKAELEKWAANRKPTEGEPGYNERVKLETERENVYMKMSYDILKGAAGSGYTESYQEFTQRYSNNYRRPLFFVQPMIEMGLDPTGERASAAEEWNVQFGWYVDDGKVERLYKGKKALYDALGVEDPAIAALTVPTNADDNNAPTSPAGVPLAPSPAQAAAAAQTATSPALSSVMSTAAGVVGGLASALGRGLFGSSNVAPPAPAPAPVQAPAPAPVQAPPIQAAVEQVADAIDAVVPAAIASPDKLEMVREFEFELFEALGVEELFEETQENDILALVIEGVRFVDQLDDEEYKLIEEYKQAGSRYLLGNRVIDHRYLVQAKEALLDSFSKNDWKGKIEEVRANPLNVDSHELRVRYVNGLENEFYTELRTQEPYDGTGILNLSIRGRPFREYLTVEERVLLDQYNDSQAYYMDDGLKSSWDELFEVYKDLTDLIKKNGTRRFHGRAIPPSDDNPEPVVKQEPIEATPDEATVPILSTISQGIAAAVDQVAETVKETVGVEAPLAGIYEQIYNASVTLGPGNQSNNGLTAVCGHLVNTLVKNKAQLNADETAVLMGDAKTIKAIKKCGNAKNPNWVRLKQLLRVAQAHGLPAAPASGLTWVKKNA